MRTLTKILIGLGAGVIAVGSYATGFAVGDDGDVAGRRAGQEVHAPMGDMPMGAMDPAVMDDMHEQMVDQLPPALRDDADAMHESMTEVRDTMRSTDGHGPHHPFGS